MFALISYPIGVIADCLILSRNGNLIRVVVPGMPDTIELEYRDSQWFTSEGEQIDLDFVSAVAVNDSPTEERVLAAGSRLV